jgi:hypothetical protein
MANLPKVDYNDLADDDVRAVKDEGVRSALYRLTEKLKRIFAYQESLVGTTSETTTAAAASSSTSTLTSIGSAGTMTPTSYPLVLTAADSGKVILVTTTAARSITLPKPAAGLIYTFKDATGTAATYNITLVRFGSTEKIDTVAASYVCKYNFGTWTLKSDGTDWFIVCASGPDIDSEDGSFSGNLTGMTASISATVNYSRRGNVVTMRLPFTGGTSNTTAMRLQSVPTNLQPVNSQIIVILVSDNGFPVFGYVIPRPFSEFIFGSGAYPGTFTASGAKGTQDATFTYLLN